MLIHFQTTETRTELNEQWTCTFFFRRPERPLVNKIKGCVQTEVSPQVFCAIFEISGALKELFMVDTWQIVHCKFN